MLEIKPDTSLYTDLPNKLRALALVLESDGERQWKYKAVEWEHSMNTTEGVLKDFADCNYHYRIKPKPRELWVLYGADGIYLNTYVNKFTPDPGFTVVHFVERPE